MTATNPEHVYRSALENRILDRLNGGPQTSAELLDVIDVSPGVLFPVLRKLLAAKAIEAQEAKLLGIRGKGRVRYVYSVSRLSETR